MKYDISSPDSIEKYAQELEGYSLSEKLGNQLIGERFSSKGKGKLGQLVEEAYFGYNINSRKEADFKEAEMELKVVPLKSIKIKKSSSLKREQQGIAAKERIVLSLINYMEIHKEEWENNSLFEKCKSLLLMFYKSNKDVPVEEQVFELIQRWVPSNTDLAIIQKDWELIVDKIKKGKAHEISEGDTLYLGACTKGSTREKSQRQQPFSEELASQRAFCFKNAYVNAIIEQLLQQRTYEVNKKQVSIEELYKTRPFDEVILEIYNRSIGKTVEEMMEQYSIIRERKAKNFLSLIVNDVAQKVFRAKLSDLMEFKKANIEIKTILLKPNGMPKESMSFEQIDYCEIVSEEWEESTIREKFENKKQLWIVFKANRNFDKQSELELNEINLHKVMFWNMPYEDLEGSMKRVWQHTVDKIKQGDYENFIKIADNEIGHIRPKAQNQNDKAKTPQGTWETKKCFWLNARYIKEQIEK